MLIVLIVFLYLWQPCSENSSNRCLTATTRDSFPIFSPFLVQCCHRYVNIFGAVAITSCVALHNAMCMFQCEALHNAMCVCFSVWPYIMPCVCFSFTEKEIPLLLGSMYKCPDLHARAVQEQALAGMFGTCTPGLSNGGVSVAS